MIFIIVLFIICVTGGWLISQFFIAILFGKEKETYIDKSVHHHTTINNHLHNSISIIDDAAKEVIFEHKESMLLKKSDINCPNCEYYKTTIFKRKIQECNKCKQKYQYEI